MFKLIKKDLIIHKHQLQWIIGYYLIMQVVLFPIIIYQKIHPWEVLEMSKQFNYVRLNYLLIGIVVIGGLVNVFISFNLFRKENWAYVLSVTSDRVTIYLSKLLFQTLIIAFHVCILFLTVFTMISIFEFSTIPTVEQFLSLFIEEGGSHMFGDDLYYALYIILFISFLVCEFITNFLIITVLYKNNSGSHRFLKQLGFILLYAITFIIWVVFNENTNIFVYWLLSTIGICLLWSLINLLMVRRIEI